MNNNQLTGSLMTVGLFLVIYSAHFKQDLPLLIGGCFLLAGFNMLIWKD